MFSLGVTDQTLNVRHYVFSNFPTQSPDFPRLKTTIGKELNCEEFRDRYTGPPRGTDKELVYPCSEGHRKMWGSRPSNMLENTLFRGVFSNPWYLDQVTRTDIVTKSDVYDYS
jgi:hypothetical protein